MPSHKAVAPGTDQHPDYRRGYHAGYSWGSRGFACPKHLEGKVKLKLFSHGFVNGFVDARKGRETK